MTRLHFRDHVAASLSWIGAGLCWVTQLFVPWTSVGALSASSQLDGFRLVRRGAVDSVAPSWSAWLLLVLPAAGLVLVALAGLAGGGATVARLALAASGVVLLALALHGLVAWDLRRLGPGGWTSLAGCALALGAALLERLRATEPALTPEVVP